MSDGTVSHHSAHGLTMSPVLDPQERARLEKLQVARDQIAEFRTLNIDFFPRESHLVTLRDPWSFPVLFHPGCNHLIRGHLEELSRKVSRDRILVLF